MNQASSLTPRTRSIPDHANPQVNYECLCGPQDGGTAPNDFRLEWFGSSDGSDGLAMQCATCLSKAVPGATDLTIDLASAISTYCYIPPGSLSSRNQLLGWASNDTFTYKVLVTLLNYTIATKTPWTIPNNVDWDTAQPW
jgi:hypothetical protein